MQVRRVRTFGNISREITRVPSDHDTIGLFEDLVEVVQTLLVFNLANDLDVLSHLPEQSADVTHILGFSREGSGNEIHTLIHSEKKILCD